MTTLNLQVEAGVDDAYSHSGGVHTNTSTILVVGFVAGSSYDSYYRFTGASKLLGQTIDFAALNIYEDDSMPTVGAPKTKIFAEVAAAPVVVTTRAAHVAKPRTTAGVEWDTSLTVNSWNASPSIASVIQELVALEPSEILILHDDDATPPSSYLRLTSYNFTPAWAPKLDIDYYTNEFGAVGEAVGAMHIRRARTVTY